MRVFAEPERKTDGRRTEEQTLLLKMLQQVARSTWHRGKLERPKAYGRGLEILAAMYASVLLAKANCISRSGVKFIDAIFDYEPTRWRFGNRRHKDRWRPRPRSVERLSSVVARFECVWQIERDRILDGYVPEKPWKGFWDTLALTTLGFEAFDDVLFHAEFYERRLMPWQSQPFPGTDGG